MLGNALKATGGGRGEQSSTGFLAGGRAPQKLKIRLFIFLLKLKLTLPETNHLARVPVRTASFPIKYSKSLKNKNDKVAVRKADVFKERGLIHSSAQWPMLVLALVGDASSKGLLYETLKGPL